MQDSERYESQAREVMRMVRRFKSPVERDICLSIAEGWRKLAAEAARIEARERRPPEPRILGEPRSFKRTSEG